MKVGSEWAIIGYSVIGFLFLFLFRTYMNRVDKTPDPNTDQSLEKKMDPFTIGVQILCLAVLIFCTIGIGKGVIETYDYCSLVVDNTTVSGAVTTFNYDHVCIENDNGSDESIYDMSYMIMYTFIALFIIGIVWQMFLFIKDQILPGIKNFFVKRRR